MPYRSILFVALSAALSPVAYSAVSECLLDTEGTLAVSTPSVILGQSTTLSWNVETLWASTSCSQRKQYISGIGQVPPKGSMAISPTANGTWKLYAQEGGQVKNFNSVSVAVSGSISVQANGRPLIRIDRDNQQALFIKGISTPNADVVLADELNMDLSNYSELQIFPGVHIMGGRSSRKPGPRLYSTRVDVADHDWVMFHIGERLDADNVRISGIRLDGGVMDVRGDQDGPESSGWTAIAINSSVNVEIDNNEIYGWPGRGVTVLDDRYDRLRLDNAAAVHVHDNYIHHIRHWRREGYGVQSNDGAYVLIERNVFDYNRHAIEASGAPGTGYLAYSNLLLENGGENFDLGLGATYTHQFDVHGTESCGWKDAYCGPAGQYFDYRYNTLLYTKHTPLKVRGVPAIRGDVTRNVFKVEAYVTPRVQGFDAIEQTEGSNLLAWSNQFGKSPSRRDAICDFDGDGRADDFMSTGATWWFKGITGEWNYLNTSTKMAPELTFYDFSGDGRCDIKVPAEGVFFSGGHGPKQLIPVLRTEVSAKRTDLVWVPASGGTGRARVWRLSSTLKTVLADFMVNAPTADSTLLGTGDFNADGAADLLWRDLAGRVFVSLLDDTGSAVESIGSRTPQKGIAPLQKSFDGIGDFDGDGRADILWHDMQHQYEIWFAGESGNTMKVSWRDSVAGPTDAAWTVQGIGDFDGNGKSDILWRDGVGFTAIQLDGGSGLTTAPGPSDNTWQIQGIGDFDGNGKSDILWRSTEGFTGIWHDGGTGPVSSPGPTDNTWQIQGVGDFDADGRSDILWRQNTGAAAIWRMAGGVLLGNPSIPSLGTEWQLKGLLPQAPQRLDMQ